MKKLLLIVALLMPLMVLAQDFSLQGQVYMLNGLPVQNFPVKSMKTGEVVKTDTTGAFSINTMDKDVLLFETSPFISQKYKVKVSKKGIVDAPDIALNFRRNKSVLKEIIKKGYLKEDYEGEALINLDVEKDYTKYGDITAALQVEFPTLTISNSCCLISPTSGSQDCMLLIIDNKEASCINEIVLGEVAKMYVLKANDAAIYGTKAKNDVFVVKYRGGNSIVDLDDK